ncbi:hypothetical protein [Autumnicola musiva]|uniref:Uncharacterized protein n=1 Tax=Autumnicola musiva TaxID=3075589 RepID=A0ABU3D7T4_9FLAO|nr:hypothetical protein [Zunongwangia sp. F117]MDT0677590.1 hypothetical protein [Zunongwangia sp. F117]
MRDSKMFFPFPIVLLMLFSSVINGVEEVKGKSIPGSAQQLDQTEKKGNSTWQGSDFEIESKGYESFKTVKFGQVLSGANHNIMRVAPEIEGLTGVKIPADRNKNDLHSPLKLSFIEPVKVLIAIFGNKSIQKFDTEKYQRLLGNALTVTGLPAANIYAVSYPAGRQEINLEGLGSFTIVGVIKNEQDLIKRDVELPDGRQWDTFIIEGYSDEKPLFEILRGPEKPVVDEGMPGTEGIQGGFEGGRCVKINGMYHMFPTERAGEIGVEAYHDRIKTRIGHWTSDDAINWKRQSTLYQSSGNYALTEDDNPINDRRAAIWSFMPIFNEEANRWYGFYLAYTVHEEIEPNHSFGRIWQAESVKEGMEGIGGPYKDKGIIIEPGLNSQPWEGRQGVASFFPFKVDNQWLGFYSGAYPFDSWKDYPKKTGEGWFVGLAEADKLEGPWARMDTTLNPIKSIHPNFVENPIVSQLSNGLYIAIFDGGPEGWGHHLPNMIGYSISKNGYNWSEARYVPIETKVNKWWDIMRTPLCLIPEGNDVYTIMYAAIDLDRRFHPMGMVKVKLNSDVLGRFQK